METGAVRMAISFHRRTVNPILREAIGFIRSHSRTSRLSSLPPSVWNWRGNLPTILIGAVCDL